MKHKKLNETNKKEHDYLQQRFDVRQAIWRRKKSFFRLFKSWKLCHINFSYFFICSSSKLNTSNVARNSKLSMFLFQISDVQHAQHACNQDYIMSESIVYNRHTKIFVFK